MAGWPGCGCGGGSRREHEGDHRRLSELASRRRGSYRTRSLLRRSTVGERGARRASIRERRRAARGGGTNLVGARARRSEEHTSELQSQSNLVCRLLLVKTKQP